MFRVEAETGDFFLVTDLDLLSSLLVLADFFEEDFLDFGFEAAPSFILVPEALVLLEVLMLAGLISTDFFFEEDFLIIDFGFEAGAMVSSSLLLSEVLTGLISDFFEEDFLVVDFGLDPVGEAMV